MKWSLWELAAVSATLAGCFGPPATAEDPKPTPREPVRPSAQEPARPFLAIWCQSEGRRLPEGDAESGYKFPDRGAPYLRIAIWDDGRVLFARDPTRWSHDLRESRIPPERVARLKREAAATGVFDLKGNAALVPCAPVYCLMLDLGEKQQTLYWDEVETPGYGINSDPKPHHLRFKECWNAVNRLALAAIPSVSEPAKERFEAAPASWYLKEAIASE